MFLAIAGSRTRPTGADRDPGDPGALAEQATHPRDEVRADRARMNGPLRGGDRPRVLTAAAGSRCQARAGIGEGADRGWPGYGATAVGGATPLAGDAAGAGAGGGSGVGSQVRSGGPARMREPACGCLRAVAGVPR